MSNFKHNKLRNTGLLFEFLLRQVTVDVLNKKKDSVALKIIKKKFNENTEMGKELALYNLLIQKKFKSESKADFFLSEILRQRAKLNNSVFRTDLIEIPVCYDHNLSPDMNRVKKITSLEKEKIISLHSSNDYIVYFIGFSPQFPYLGGM